jgi:hypothetical protein
MITITNNKIASLSPFWASFKGFSLLFDNPAPCFRPHNDLEFIDCSLAPPGTLSLYEKLRDALEVVGGPLLTTAFLFCPLPFASYHVTMLDGVNMDNVSSTQALYRKELQACITDIESAIGHMPQCTAFLEAALRTQRFQELSFYFAGLEIWGHQVLVALLTPTADSGLAFHTLSTTRGELAEKLLAELNVPSFPYTPHVSLGYFANREAGLLARAHLAEWAARFENTVKDARVSFHSVSLYGFTDMARFFRVR